MLKTALIKSIYIGWLAAFCASAALADIYKWVDEDGNVHYTSKPPLDDGVEVENIKPLPQFDSSGAVDALREKQAIGEAVDTYKEDTAALKESKKKRAAVRKENCEKLRAKLANVQSRGRIKGVDEEGNITRTTEEERQRRIRDAQEKIKIWCD